MMTLLLTTLIILAHNVTGWQSSIILVKRAHEDSAPRLLLDLNKSPPREDTPTEREQAATPMPTSHEATPTALRPRRPYVYYPRKQAHELSMSKKAIKSRIAREKIRESRNESVLINYLEKQRMRMEPTMEKYRNETKELGYSTRPFTIKNREIRNKIKQGTATDVERQYMKKVNSKFNESPSNKKRVDNMKITRQRVRLGMADEKDREALEKRKKADQRTYQRRKERKLNPDEI